MFLEIIDFKESYLCLGINEKKKILVISKCWHVGGGRDVEERTQTMLHSFRSHLFLPTHVSVVTPKGPPCVSHYFLLVCFSPTGRPADRLARTPSTPSSSSKGVGEANVPSPFTTPHHGNPAFNPQKMGTGKGVSKVHIRDRCVISSCDIYVPINHLKRRRESVILSWRYSCWYCYCMCYCFWVLVVTISDVDENKFIVLFKLIPPPICLNLSSL